MTSNNLKVETKLKISKTAHEIYDAIIDPTIMSHYFISRGSAKMESGKTIHWDFADAGATVDIKVQKLEKDKYISFLWSAIGNETLVTITLQPMENATLIKITEDGWNNDQEGAAKCINQSKGWVFLLCCLKAYLEHGIDLRKNAVVGGKL